VSYEYHLEPGETAPKLFEHIPLENGPGPAGCGPSQFAADVVARGRFTDLDSTIRRARDPSASEWTRNDVRDSSDNCGYSGRHVGSSEWVALGMPALTQAPIAAVFVVVKYDQTKGTIERRFIATTRKEADRFACMLGRALQGLFDANPPRFETRTHSYTLADVFRVPAPSAGVWKYKR
jgi:hypothetical protein